MKEMVQRIGRFLSGMIMPNIGAFIAWGLITALFIPTGWLPNETFAEIVGPMLSYLLPILIGYTGGTMLYGQRGGVVGSIATIGVVIGAEIPMFLGAMIAGPAGGYCMKKFDELVQDKIPAGFEMLVNNFSAGILGGILAMIAFVAINPFCLLITDLLRAGVGFFVDHGLLPLVAIFVEPGKILFLNNAINHGIFTPLGAEQVATAGKSIFFMIESNPGTAMGMLLAYCLVGKGIAKASAPGAAIIHFLGGIHEIYFPYVLMNPILIIAMIGGSITNIFLLTLFGGGLIAPASPGSIIAEILMTPKGAYFANFIAITMSGIVSFVLSVFLLRFFGKDEDSLESAQLQVSGMKAIAKGKVNSISSSVKSIVFACDAGMGSSAMGATMLRKKLTDAGITDIEVIHSPVGEIKGKPEIIVVHHELKDRAATRCPNARLITISNFMNAPEYDTLVAELLKTHK